MKKTKPPGRQILVLTPEEKKAVLCVLGVLLLGLGTKHYRAAHPGVPPTPTLREQHASQRAVKAAAARARSARGKTVAQSTPITSQEAEDDE